MSSNPELQMPTKLPTAKLIASTIAVFLAPILLFAVNQAWPDLPLPDNAESLLEALVEGVIIGLAGLGVGWLKRPAARDVPISAPPAPPAGVSPPPEPGGGIDD